MPVPMEKHQEIVQQQQNILNALRLRMEFFLENDFFDLDDESDTSSDESLSEHDSSDTLSNDSVFESSMSDETGDPEEVDR